MFLTFDFGMQANVIICQWSKINKLHESQRMENFGRALLTFRDIRYSFTGFRQSNFRVKNQINFITKRQNASTLQTYK